MGAAVKPLRTESTRFNRTGPTRKPKSPLDKAKAYEVIWNQVSGLFDAARPYADACFVYFIGETDDGPLKIGHSKDPVARLRTMQTGNPRRLRIEYVLVGDMPLEKLLHELWEPFAVISSRSVGKPGAAPGTEWFKPEARDTLLPIIADAVSRQIECLSGPPDVGFGTLERIVRDAHAESGFVARGRDEVRLLAQGAGYVVRRPSRL